MIVHVTRDVRDPRLALHVRPGPGVCQAVFGWDVEPPPVDAGPPPPIVDVFATALAATGPIAFLHEPPAALAPGWQALGDDHWLALSRGPRIAVVATRAAARIRAMFSSIASWELQAQVGMILRDGPLPALSRDLLDRITAARDVPLASLALPDAIRALILPAVDGDFLELAARDPRACDDLRAAVATTCRARGIGFDPR